MRDNGTPIALGVVALLTAGAALSSRRGGSQRGPGPQDRSYLPPFRDVKEVLDNGYTVDEVSDTFPDAISFPSSDVVGVIINTRDAGSFLLVDRGGRAQVVNQGRGSRAAAAAAGVSLASTAATGLLVYMGYRFIKKMAKKKLSRFVQLDRAAQVQMLRDEAAKQGSILFPSGYIARFAWTAALKDPQRAATIAQFIEEFVQEHGEEAEAAADLALAANVPGSGPAMAMQRAARHQREG